MKLRDYGMEPFFTGSQQKAGDIMPAVTEALESGKGYVFFCYEPNYYWFIHEMIMLEEPEYDPSNYKIVSNEDPDWFKKSKITTGDEKKKVHVAYSKSLEKRTPKVAALLANISLDVASVNKLSYELSIKKRDPMDVAREWVAENSSKVDGWLK